jgi:hypothetical protein
MELVAKERASKCGAKLVTFVLGQVPPRQVRKEIVGVELVVACCQKIVINN